MRGKQKLTGLRIPPVFAAAMVVFAFAGCGGSGHERAATGGSTGKDSRGVADAVAMVEQARAIPDFRAPGPAFDTSKATGKTVMVIPATSTVSYIQVIIDRMKAIGREQGIKVVDWPNQGTRTQWAQGVQSAIDRKVDSIDLLAGLDPAAVKPQLDAARKAGISVVVSSLSDPSAPLPAGVTAAMPVPYKEGGRLMADWAIADSRGDANVLVLTVGDTPASTPIVDGINAALKDHCPNCKSSVLDFTIENFATQAQPQVQSALVRDPSINYVLPIYDSALAPFAQAAVRAAGAGERVKVVTLNGTPSALKDLANHNGIAMDVGMSLDWIAHGIIDQHLRLLAGEQPLKSENVPVRVFDATNVDETGTPPDVKKGYGDAYIAGYQGLWK